MENGPLKKAWSWFLDQTGLDGSGFGPEPPRSVVAGNAGYTPTDSEDPVTSAGAITDFNNASGKDAVNSANDVNQETTDDAFNKYLQSLEYLGSMNMSSAEKIMQMNEEAQIHAYNRNLSYIDEYYPRVIDSMKRAGINPILAASRGFGSPSTVSSAAQISSPYVTSPSQLSGFSSHVAQLDYNTMRDVLTQILGDKTDLKEAEISALAKVFSAIAGANLWFKANGST